MQLFFCCFRRFNSSFVSWFFFSFVFYFHLPIAIYFQLCTQRNVYIVIKVSEIISMNCTRCIFKRRISIRVWGDFEIKINKKKAAERKRILIILKFFQFTFLFLIFCLVPISSVFRFFLFFCYFRSVFSCLLLFVIIRFIFVKIQHVHYFTLLIFENNEKTK